MRFFLWFNFVVQIVLFLGNVLEMGVCEWPKPGRPKTLGAQVAGALLSLAMIIWVGALLFY